MNFQNSENPDYSGKSQLEMIEESLPRYNNHITEMITRNFPKNSSGGRDYYFRFWCRERLTCNSREN